MLIALDLRLNLHNSVCPFPTPPHFSMLRGDDYKLENQKKRIKTLLNEIDLCDNLLDSFYTLVLVY